MYICSKCGEAFEVPDTREERPCCDFPETETWCCCPNCHSDDYEEAVKCLICEEWHSELKCENGVCEECVKTTMKQFYELILNTFDDNERMVIAENIELNLI